MFITIESIDGGGSTTHTKNLAEWFSKRGHEIMITREPSDGLVGKLIRDSLQENTKLENKTYGFLFAADRFEHLTKEIIPALNQNKVVICDRYVYSSLAYQSMYQRLHEVLVLNNSFKIADIAVLVDTPSTEAFSRIQGRESLSAYDKDMKLQNHVRGVYRFLFNREPDTVSAYSFATHHLIVNGDQPQELVFSDIISGIQPWI